MGWPPADDTTGAPSRFWNARGTTLESAELQGHVFDAPQRRRRRAQRACGLSDGRPAREGLRLIEQKGVPEISCGSSEFRTSRASTRAAGLQDQGMLEIARRALFRLGGLRVMRVRGLRFGIQRVAARGLGRDRSAGEPEPGQL